MSAKLAGTVTVTVGVKLTGGSADTLQRVRNALADRRGINAAVAVRAATATRDYLLKVSRHKTADSLGAQPTGFLAKQAKLVQADSNAELAMVRMPRASGLGRAFHEITLVPKSGRKFLTIPATAETYGKRAGEFPQDAFAFAVVGGRYPALVWRKSSGTHRGWTVAYWLRRKVVQKQDRTLLPSKEGYAQIANAELRTYLRKIITEKN